MATTTYDYVIATSTLNGLIDSQRLELEIRKSPNILVAFAFVNLDLGAGAATIGFKAPLSGPEEVALGQLLAVHTGQPLPDPMNDEGVPYVALYGGGNRVQTIPREGTQIIRATHNYCDPTTWYSASQRVTEVLTPKDGANLVWVSANKNWIGIDQGQVHDEDSVVAYHKASNPSDPHGYLISVAVGGVVQKRRPRRYSDWNGGGAAFDYVVDYKNGEVEFQVAPSSAPQVKYSYATTSEWFLSPEPGKILAIESAELQWTVDLDFNADIVQDAQVPVVPSPDPTNPTHWMTVDSTVYKSFGPIADEARGSYPKQGPVGGTPPNRGAISQYEHAPLIYSAVKELRSSMGLRLRTYLGHVWYDENGNKQVAVVGTSGAGTGGFGGERATATFYAITLTE